MMKKQNYKLNLQVVAKLFICLMLVLTPALMNAQVTIGSNITPAEGSILDLKESGMTTKGLAMPRVDLQGINSLKMGENAPALTGEETAHMGLMVYNISTSNGFCPGLYVWDGGKWIAVGGGGDNTKPDLSVVIDGETYTAKWFTSGSHCDPTVGAYWLTQNLYTTTTNQGASFATAPRMNPAYYNNINGSIEIGSKNDLAIGSTPMPTYAEWTATGTIPSEDTTAERIAFAKKFGLLYTFEQASVACPINWHLPTNADWDNLALAMGGASEAGKKMRANDNFYRTNDANPYTYQWGANDGGITPSGFNALPSGYVRTDGVYASDFGYASHWWTAVDTGKGTRILLKDTKNLTGLNNGLGLYISVRCVKD